MSGMRFTDEMDNRDAMQRMVQEMVYEQVKAINDEIERLTFEEVKKRCEAAGYVIIPKAEYERLVGG